MTLASPASGRRPITVSLLGLPFDLTSTYLRGPAEAPPHIRAALYSDSSNLWTEDGLDLGRADTFHDVGDLSLPSDAQAAAEQMEAAVRQLVDLDQPLVCLGGNHAITYPVLRGFRHKYPALTVLHLDAHPDLYHDLGGRFSHASQFARVMEEGLARRLVQVGIRTMNGHQLEQARRFGVEVISMRRLPQLADLKLAGPLYVSFDVDVLDPAFAPGVSHFEPGGLSVREALALLQSLPGPLVGADLVEYNPRRDHHTQTAMVCGKVLKELTAAMLRGGPAEAEAEAWI